VGPRVLFLCFLLSGFTGLLYQTVWIRLSLASFGVNSSVVATVLAVFMLGLALGTVLAGRYGETVERRLGWRGLQLYALAELLIGLGGMSVPSLLEAARTRLLAVGPADGALYTLASAVLFSSVLLPFCTAMGLTFPTALSYLKRRAASGQESETFSYLYLANVAGALAGVLLTSVVLIEELGFLTTSFVAAGVNALIATLAVTLVPSVGPGGAAEAEPGPLPAGDGGLTSRARLTALFLTGFCTMGVEVVWTRIYPFFVSTFVYSFAGILATYLVATAFGSSLYRMRLRSGRTVRLESWWPWLGAAALLPLFSASIRYSLWGPWRILLGLTPFCALLGFVTPSIVDAEAGNDPRRIGRAYGLNLVGGVLGPLAAGFLLVPAFGPRTATLVLALPLFLFLPSFRFRTRASLLPAVAALAGGAALWSSTRLFEEQFPREQVRNDHAATVVAAGSGREAQLFVNGVGMTGLTPITKMMAHFPAAHLPPRPGRPLDGLVICFGMGTSLRSLAAWGANVTSVELIPSVPKLFGYFYPDGPDLLRSRDRTVRVEIDDGRRYLDRTRETFDLILVDPPPPVEAAASSLLYSKEFYRSAIARLRPEGILQAWLPGGDGETVAAVTEAILESFAHVRAFRSVGGWGIHYLASRRPIPPLTAEELRDRMPEAAVRDMTEWGGGSRQPLRLMLARELDPRSLATAAGETAPITDDRPLNEFFLVRRYLARRP